MRLVALDFYRMCREETRETQTYDLILPLQSDDADDRSLTGCNQCFMHAAVSSESLMGEGLLPSSLTWLLD